MVNSVQHMHRVVCLAFEDVQVLDVTGPLEVFGRAARWLRDEGRTPTLPYSVELVAERAGPVRTSSGFALHASRSWREVESADTLLIAGGIGWPRAAADHALRDWLRGMQARGTRLASICTGALILAAAGLLDGKRATTHWAYCKQLQQMARGSEVDADAIFVRADARLWTSAGVTAGMDLALAMVEQDHDAGTALAVAQQLVMFLKRPGGQSQFSRTLSTQALTSDRLRDLQAWMLEHLDADLSIPALAARVAMSPRNFARRFAAEAGVSPARHVEQLRCEAARRRLEESRAPIGQIAREVGFGSDETLRRAFQRHLGMAPAEYRRRFGDGD